MGGLLMGTVVVLNETQEGLWKSLEVLDENLTDFWKNR